MTSNREFLSRTDLKELNRFHLDYSEIGILNAKKELFAKKQQTVL
jgi:hypothetical protein